MTWVERIVDEFGIWAVVHTPDTHGYCIFGELWLGVHAHLLNEAGMPGVVVTSWPR